MRGVPKVSVATACQLTDRRSMARSPVDGHGVPGNRQALQNSSWTSSSQASRAVTQRHLGCIDAPLKNADTKKVDQ